MRVIIASRIFAPEPAAAAFRLDALAAELSSRGHEVTVVTSLFRGAREGQETPAFHIRRAPVLRDRNGAVRGYVQYLSFDVPLFFRLLFLRTPDVFVVEPPPTTGLVVRIIAALKRRPFVYYTADVLADAAEGAGSPGIVVRVLRLLERECWRYARAVLAVSEDVQARLVDLGVQRSQITIVGNGVSTEVFTFDGDAVVREHPYVLYAGTASEVHGAGIFVEAMALVQSGELIFLGSGTDFQRLAEKAIEIAPGRVMFMPTVSPAEAAAWFRGAALAVASLRPGGKYDFAFPTKLYAASACGTPVLFCGPGPGADYVRESPSGTVVEPEPTAVAVAIREALGKPRSARERRSQASWAGERVSLSEVAHRSSDVIEAAAFKAGI